MNALTFDYLDGMLIRFQNTDVESRWRKAATQHLDRITPYLDDIELRWLSQVVGNDAKPSYKWYRVVNVFVWPIARRAAGLARI